MAQLVLLNKPFQVLPQFTDDGGRATLADYVNVPKVYAAGRLDYDSEGLMLLTDNGALQHLISHPSKKMAKTYFAQVEGEISKQALQDLRQGIVLKDGPTAPAMADRVEEPSWLWPRVPPIRERAAIPTTWLRLTIQEGRNRQVRRMTAHVGFPTLRLVRYSVGEWTLDGLGIGEYKLLEVDAPSSPRQSAQRRKPATGKSRRPSHGRQPRRGNRT